MTVNKYGFVLNWFVSIMRSICKSEHFEIDRQDFCPWQKFTFYVFCSFFLETRGLLARLKLIMKISHRIWNAVINDRRERINGFHSIIWMVLLFKRFIILFYLQLQRINTIRLQCRIQNTKYTSNSVKLPLIFGIGLRFFSLSKMNHSSCWAQRFWSHACNWPIICDSRIFAPQAFLIDKTNIYIITLMRFSKFSGESFCFITGVCSWWEKRRDDLPNMAWWRQSKRKKLTKYRLNTGDIDFNRSCCLCRASIS